MSPADVQTVVIDALAEVAPELDPETLDRARAFREQLDVDSIDFLRFVQALCRRTGLEIAERDYAQLDTVDRASRFIAARLAEAHPAQTGAR